MLRNLQPDKRERRCPRWGRRQAKGFTLIKLLVVISVIALLMAILLPSLQKARRMAQASVCRSNLKQWGLIFQLYAFDNDHKLPQSIAGAGLNAQDAYWILATLNYYQEKEIRLCP